MQASATDQIWQSDMTKIWAGPAVGWAYVVSVIDCCTREVVSCNFSTVVERKMRWLPWSRPY